MIYWLYSLNWIFCHLTSVFILVSTASVNSLFVSSIKPNSVFHYFHDCWPCPCKSLNSSNTRHHTFHVSCVYLFRLRNPKNTALNLTQWHGTVLDGVKHATCGVNAHYTGECENTVNMFRNTKLREHDVFSCLCYSVREWDRSLYRALVPTPSYY